MFFFLQSYVVCELPEKLNFLFSFIRNHIKSKILVFVSSCKQVRICVLFQRNVHAVVGQNEDYIHIKHTPYVTCAPWRYNAHSLHHKYERRQFTNTFYKRNKKTLVSNVLLSYIFNTWNFFKNIHEV